MRKPSLFRRLVTSVLVANCIVLAPYGPPLAHATSTVVIGEVAWAGSSLSTADEWIELWNLGDVPAEIGGYKLQQGSDGVITLPADAVIPPQSAYLVSNYAADDAKSVLASASQYVTTGISLSNSASSITLLDAASGTVDQVGTGGKPPAGSSGTIKATMIRTGDAWITATNSQGFDEGRTELGTPGVCDGCQVPEPAPVVIEPLPVETPPVIVEVTPTETVDTPIAATSIEPVTEPVVPETPVVEAPVAEASPTSNVIPPCQVIYIPIGQPIPTPEVVEAPPAPAPDPTIADPMTVDPIMTALEPILNIEPVTTPSEEPTSPLVEQTVIPTDNATTSSTQPTSGSVAETATATEPVSTTTTAEVTPTETTPVESVATVAADPTPAPAAPTVPRYDLLRLNEFSAHPVGESERIEITSLDTNTSIALDGVTLYDSAGKIYTFATGTLDTTERFAIATLASSRLNNDGDTVYLKDPNGTVLDSVHYEGSKANWTWSRLPDGTGAWVETSIPSLGDLNIAPPIETPVQTTPPTSTTMSQVTVTPPIETAAAASTTLPIMSVATSVSTPTSTSSTPKKTVTKTKETKTTTVKETVTPKATVTKTTTKTTTTKSTKATSASKTTTKTTSIPSISFDMNDYETSRGIRVSLQGQVGSPSGLLSSHAFILLSPDGRGLQVRVPTAKKLPDMNEVVVVQGTLLFTDAGTPYLKLGANDDWKTITDATQATKSRAANLFTPSAEDAWSLVAATGTVRRINASSATIEIDGADVDVAIKKILQYRLSRLSVGDVLSVTGLLDVSSDVPKIVPRSEQEIALIAHAPVQTAKGNPTGLPGWTPFGAAGVAIAGTEGFKQLRDRRKRQALEEIVETRLNTTV